MAATQPNAKQSLERKPLLIGALLAVSPDFDYFFVWILGMEYGWHRGFMHSLAFAISVSLLAAVMTGEIRKTLPYIIATASHAFADAVTTLGNPGVEFFWPFTIQRVKLGLFEYFDAPLKLGRQPWPQLLVGVIKISLIEAVLFGPFFYLVLLIKRRRRQTGLDSSSDRPA